MQYLFNSHGDHIANFVNGHLHAPSGQNIGHYLEKERIFIDMDGHYLGEIIRNDRLMRKISSPYKMITYGEYGTHSNVGNYGNPGNHSSVGSVSGLRF